MISIVIKVYNEEKYIYECLLSICSQISPEDEVIIVDDGSTDESASIINDFISKNGLLNVFYYYKNNGGPGSACNTGISLSKKDYIYIMDGDDLLSDNAIPTFKKILHEQNPDILIFDIDHILLNGEINTITSNIIVDQLDSINVTSKLFNIVPSVTNKIVKRDIIIESGLLFLDILVAEDLNFMTKLYSFINSYYYLPVVKYKYIEREGSIISSKDSVDKNKDVIFAIRDIVNFYHDKNNNMNILPDIYKLIQTHGYLYTTVRVMKQSINYRDSEEIRNFIKEECNKLLRIVNVHFTIKIDYYLKNPKFVIIKALDKLNMLNVISKH